MNEESKRNDINSASHNLKLTPFIKHKFYRPNTPFKRPNDKDDSGNSSLSQNSEIKDANNETTSDEEYVFKQWSIKINDLDFVDLEVLKQVKTIFNQKTIKKFVLTGKYFQLGGYALNTHLKIVFDYNGFICVYFIGKCNF